MLGVLRLQRKSAICKLESVENAKRRVICFGVVEMSMEDKRISRLSYFCHPDAPKEGCARAMLRCAAQQCRKAMLERGTMHV